MRTLLLLAPLTLLSLLAMPGVAAAAETVTIAPMPGTVPAAQSLPVLGRVPQVCAMQPGRIAAGSLNNIAGLDGDTLRIIQFTDPSTLTVRAASVTVSFDAFCNFPHSVRIESQNNGLWPVDARVSDRPAGFGYAVPYTARLNWGPANTQFQATATIRNIAQAVTAVSEPAAGDLSLRIEIADGASNAQNRAPMMADTYVDTVRIFLEPQ